MLKIIPAEAKRVEQSERGLNVVGEVAVELKLENTVDRELVRRGLMKEEEVRAITTRAVVDSGAVMLVLPQEQAEALGLRETRTAIVTYADERKETRPIAGPVTVKAANREMQTECVVGPPGSEPLLGQIPLEAMDLLVDCANRQLIPRPESPFLPTLKLK